MIKRDLAIQAIRKEAIARIGSATELSHTPNARQDLEHRIDTIINAQTVTIPAGDRPFGIPLSLDGKPV